MAYRIPVWYIISTGFQGDRLRVYIKGIMESSLHFGQNVLHSYSSSMRDSTRDFHLPHTYKSVHEFSSGKQAVSLCCDVKLLV
jgi:hypothetical protein